MSTRRTRKCIDRDLAVAAQFRGQAGAGGDRQRGADDAIGAENIEPHVGDVHGAAQAPRGPRIAAHQLGHHAIDLGALGDAVAVPAMGARDVVVIAQGGAYPGGDRLLANVEMGGALDQAFPEELGGALLEGADTAHRRVQRFLDLGCEI